MNIVKKLTRIYAALALAVLAGCAGMSGSGPNVTLNGGNEVPPVSTAATGSGTITVGADLSVSGSVTVSGISPTVAHIHDGAAGTNGPVIVPMVNSADNPNVWTFAPGAKLTEAQYEKFKAGGLYVNMHTVANKGGEIRGQLRP